MTRRPVLGSALAFFLVLAATLGVATGARPGTARLEARVPAGEDPPAGQQQPQQQQQQQQPPTFRAGVKLVRVDVSVTGKDEQPVEGLEASDFEVEEDGVRQRVDTLQFVRLGAEAPREESL